MQASERVTLHAMLKKNLKGYLTSVGMWHQLVNDRLDCKICGDDLLLDNIGAIYFKNNEPQLTCDKASCYHSISVRNNT